LVRSKKRVAELESQHRINSGVGNGVGINQGNNNNLGYNIASNQNNNLSKWDQHGLAPPPPQQQFVQHSDDNSRKVIPSISNDQHDHIMLDNGGNGNESFDNNNMALSQSSGSKRKIQLSNDVGQYQQVVVTGNSGSVGSGGDSVKQRLAKHLLNREEMGCYSLPSPNDCSSPDRIAVGGDVSSSSMVVEAVMDKSSETNDKDSGDTSLSLQLLTKVNKALQQQDVSISNETQTFVKSILYQMVDAPENILLLTGTSSQDDNLSVSGLMNILLLRFNSLFHRLSTNKKEGCAATLDGDGDHIMTEDDQPKQFDHQRMVLKLLKDSSSLSDEGQVVVTYTTSSWRAVLYLLRVLHDILVLSGNARDDLRWWFYQARQKQSSSSGDGSSGGGEGRSNSPSSENGGRGKDGTVSHPRIEGLNVIKQSNVSDRKEVLWTKSCQSSSSGQHQQQSWDAMTMTQPCNQFFELLVGLMKGNISEQDDAAAIEQKLIVATSPEQTLVQSVQLKAIDLVLALMSDAPSYDHTKDCHGNKTPYLWKFWFDSLLPSPAGSTSSDDVASIGDFLYSWEKSDSTCSNIMLGGSGRKHSTRLLVDDTPIVTIQGSSSSKPKEKKKDDKKKSKEDKKKLQPVDSPKPQSPLSIVIKGRIVQLLSHFIKSSSSIGQTMYEVVDEETNTSLAKRILAAILDYAEEHIVPALSSSSTSSSQDIADEYLQLCSTCMNFLLILSKSNEGIRLLRLQMRLESEQDMPSRWSQSAVGVVTSILDGTLSYGVRVEEDENTTTPKSTSNNLSCTMNRVVVQCVTFFKTLLRFVEQQREASSSPKTTTFLAITSEHRTIFQSVCQRILSHSPSNLFGSSSLLHFSDELKLDVRDLLEEIVVDESG